MPGSRACGRTTGGGGGGGSGGSEEASGTGSVVKRVEGTISAACLLGPWQGPVVVSAGANISGVLGLSSGDAALLATYICVLDHTKLILGQRVLWGRVPAGSVGAVRSGMFAIRAKVWRHIF